MWLKQQELIFSCSEDQSSKFVALTSAVPHVVFLCVALVLSLLLTVSVCELSLMSLYGVIVFFYKGTSQTGLAFLLLLLFLAYLPLYKSLTCNIVTLQSIVYKT